MGIEIERKFLIDIQGFLTATEPTKVLSRTMLSQGYLGHDPWVRIRIADGGDAWITIKGRGAPITPEWEYTIPSKDAHELFQLCKGRITKIRRKVEYEGHTWDVDEFIGERLNGLWVAEIELKSLDESFARPPWLVEEVTGNPHYSNGWLAENGKPPRGTP